MNPQNPGEPTPAASETEASSTVPPAEPSSTPSPATQAASADTSPNTKSDLVVAPALATNRATTPQTQATELSPTSAPALDSNPGDTPTLLSFGTGHDWLRLDPRTKLLAALVVNILVLGRVTAADLTACFLFTALLLLSAVRWSLVAGWASGFVLLLGGAQVAMYSELRGTAGTLVDIFAFAGGWMSRFVVAGGIFWYLVASTTSGQLIAALTRMRLPRAVIVPVTVMLRYVPTAVADLRAIFDTMRLRGVAPSAGRVLLHPGRTVEFILVPLLASSTRIADDLTASGLVRGLGKRGRRSSIWAIGFGWADVLVVLVLAALVASRFVGR